MTPLRRDSGAERPRVPLRWHTIGASDQAGWQWSRLAPTRMPCGLCRPSRYRAYVAMDLESEREMLPHILAVDG